MGGVEAALLGLVQGLTEFLPVSSSGHLVMLQTLLELELEGVLFEVVLHVATLVSVLIFYRRRIAGLAAGAATGRPEDLAYLGKLGLATVPAAALVLVAGDFLEAQFEAPGVAGACLLVTGAILWTTRRTIRSAAADAPGWTGALLIGCAQAIAILPGISRSGSTVAMALALGVAPVAAAEFSFLLGVIAIAAAAARSLPELAAVPSDQVLALTLGGAVALVSGVAAIWLFVRMLRRQTLFTYAYYTWFAGGAFLLWLQLRG